MSDTFGLLELPVPVPADGASIADPALDMVLAFCQAVLNADLGAAWARRAPADPFPVAHTFAHNPDLESFNANETPAIYLWRGDATAGNFRMSQDYVADEGGFQGLWIPPPGAQEDTRYREAIFNGINKSLRMAMAQGRHPAWVIDGDTYYEPEDYGSVLLHHAKLGKCRLGSVKHHTLILESEDRGGGKTPFECIYFTVETLETSSIDPLAHAGHQPLASVQGTITFPDPAPDLSADDE